MPLISEFDPWSSKLCTCPEKLSLNVYTGCSHGCLYCYSSSYISNFFMPRTKKDYLKRLSSDLEKLPRNLPISISNSSDPYISLEKDEVYMRNTLSLLEEHKKLIITKSDLVARDIDLLDNAVVAITITTLDEKIAKKLEPNAPVPSKRMAALEKISAEGIPTILRLDPVIPFLNDSNEEIEKLVEKAKNAGVKHVISSTYKTKADNFERMKKAFPEFADRWVEEYGNGEFTQGSRYLPENIRREIMLRVKKITENRGMTFACCRENFPSLNTGVCDGSFLLESNR